MRNTNKPEKQLRPFGTQFLEIPDDDVQQVNGGTVFRTQAISAPRGRRHRVDRF